MTEALAMEDTEEGEIEDSDTTHYYKHIRRNANQYSNPEEPIYPNSLFNERHKLETQIGFFAFSLTFLLSSTAEGQPIFLQERRILMRETSKGAYRVLLMLYPFEYSMITETEERGERGNAWRS
ncbi:hypothetical protein NC651_040298 [Populus alba x Populus x berolinensis]|nr:hypothetical protein NC651_040298 [Populus alba x Populus x berolinensis]